MKFKKKYTQLSIKQIRSYASFYDNTRINNFK